MQSRLTSVFKPLKKITGVSDTGSQQRRF